MSEREGTAGEGVETATAEEEMREAHASHVADRPPSRDEEKVVEGRTVDPDVVEHEEDMGKRGAQVKGEGQID